MDSINVLFNCISVASYTHTRYMHEGVPPRLIEINTVCKNVDYHIIIVHCFDRDAWNQH